MIHKKRYLFLFGGMTLTLFLCACSALPSTDRITAYSDEETEMQTTEMPETDSSENPAFESDHADAATLVYMGQASMRIVTAEGKVIYIDPYTGDYTMPADLILVTHGHFDHCAVEKVENQNTDCQIITYKEAVVNGEHKSFDLGYVKIEAVEAGYNNWHDVNECVGYILTFSNRGNV